MRATVVVVEKQKVLHNLSVCVCSLGHPPCNTHTPYCHLWPGPRYNIFPHYLINGTIFEKELLNTKCVFWFSLQLLSETFHILRRIQRDMIKYVNKNVQLDSAVCRHLFTAKSLYVFLASPRPSSGALKTVTATSGIGRNTGTATSFHRGLISWSDHGGRK